jgi:hypothetical protein
MDKGSFQQTDFARSLLLTEVMQRYIDERFGRSGIKEADTVWALPGGPQIIFAASWAELNKSPAHSSLS